MSRWVAAAVLLVAAGCTNGCTDGGAATPSPPRTTRSGAASPTAPAASPTRRPGRLRVVRTHWRLPEPVAREAVVPGADGTSVVVAGGLLAGDRSTATAYSLDLRGGAVSPLPDLGTAVHDTAGVRLAGRTLVLGGGNASEQSVVQSVSRGGARVRGHLPGARSDLSAVRVGARALVVGGYDGLSPALPAVLSSRDGRRWRTVARLPVPVRYAAVVAAGATSGSSAASATGRWSTWCSGSTRPRAPRVSSRTCRGRWATRRPCCSGTGCWWPAAARARTA